MEVVCYENMWFFFLHSKSRITGKYDKKRLSTHTIHLVEIIKAHLRNDGYFWHVVLRLCFQDVKCGGYKWHVIYTVLFRWCRIHFVKYDVCFRHVCRSSDFWQPPFTYGRKKKAVFDMYMSILLHIRSWSTAPLISGFKVSKQKQEIVFGMDSLGWISS